MQWATLCTNNQQKRTWSPIHAFSLVLDFIFVGSSTEEKSDWDKAHTKVVEVFGMRNQISIDRFFVSEQLVFLKGDQLWPCILCGCKRTWSSSWLFLPFQKCPDFGPTPAFNFPVGKKTRRKNTNMWQFTAQRKNRDFHMKPELSDLTDRKPTRCWIWFRMCLGQQMAGVLLQPRFERVYKKDAMEMTAPVRLESYWASVAEKRILCCFDFLESELNDFLPTNTRWTIQFQLTSTEAGSQHAQISLRDENRISVSVRLG